MGEGAEFGRAELLDHLDGRRGKIKAPARKIPNAQHSAAKVEHGSPPDVIEAARKVMGGIDLDPASSKLFNTVVKAKCIFTEKSDGLKQQWHGRVFLNPPGCPIVSCAGRFECKKAARGEPHTHRGPSLAPLFWKKLTEEWDARRVESAVYICFSLEQLQNFQGMTVRPTDFPFCIPKSRLAFWQEVNGKLVSQTSPTHANAIIYLPPMHNRTWVGADEKVGAFVDQFKLFGAVVVPNRLALVER